MQRSDSNDDATPMGRAVGNVAAVAGRVLWQTAGQQGGSTNRMRATRVSPCITSPLPTEKA